MKHCRKLLLFLLIMICLTTLASIVRPGFLVNTKFSYILEYDNLNSFLLLVDIIITIVLFFVQDNEVKRSTIMEFQTSTVQINPGVDNYISISPCVYQLLHPSEPTSLKPYFFIQVYQEQNARCALLIPIEATIRTKTEGTNIVFSNLEIGYLNDTEEIEILPLSESFPEDFLEVKKIYQSGSKIFICFSFLLDENSNISIQNKVIIIKFLEQFTNIHEQVIKRKVELRILNSEYGLQFLGQS